MHHFSNRWWEKTVLSGFHDLPPVASAPRSLLFPGDSASSPAQHDQDAALRRQGAVQPAPIGERFAACS
jgi:hypothetical protein